jgi:hypothetical protein
VKPFLRLGVVALLGLLASCASTTSRDAATPTTGTAASDHSEVTETSAGAPATSSPASDTPPPSTDVRVMTAASCAFEYDPSTLAQRSWAFDGTLVSLGSLEDSRLGRVPSATFSVNHWYRGGGGDQVTVQFEMGPISEFAPEVEVGARLLATGEPRWGGQPLDDPVAWGCGFTQPWSADAAESWANALGE